MPRRSLKRPLVVSQPSQLKALASPTAFRIVSAFERLGSASVAELADALGEPAESLYYHVKRLTRVGILTQAGVKPTEGRSSAVYEFPGRELVLDHRNRSPPFVREMERVAGALLRMAQRGWIRALRSGGARSSGATRTLMIQQHHARLRPADLRELNIKLEEIASFIAEHDACGTTDARTRQEWVSLTMCMFPQHAETAE